MYRYWLTPDANVNLINFRRLITVWSWAPGPVYPVYSRGVWETAWICMKLEERASPLRDPSFTPGTVHLIIHWQHTRDLFWILFKQTSQMFFLNLLSIFLLQNENENRTKIKDSNLNLAIFFYFSNNVLLFFKLSVIRAVYFVKYS